MPNSAKAASTISASPSTSYPTWVIQLNTAMNFAPFGPNGARLIVNAAVPAFGPCREPNPAIRYDRLPTMITTAACQKRSPNDMISAP